jgi:hypothetical protein
VRTAHHTHGDATGSALGFDDAFIESTAEQS